MKNWVISFFFLSLFFLGGIQNSQAQTITAQDIIAGYTAFGTAKTDEAVNAYSHLNQWIWPVSGQYAQVPKTAFVGSDNCIGTIGLNILTASSTLIAGGGGGGTSGCATNGLFFPPFDFLSLGVNIGVSGWYVWYSLKPFGNFDPNKSTRYFLLYYFDASSQEITIVPWDELTLTPPPPPAGRTGVIISSQQPAPLPVTVFQPIDVIDFSFDYQVGTPVISGDVGVKITNLTTGTTTRLAKEHTFFSTSFSATTTLSRGYYEYQPFIEVDVIGSIWGGGVQDVILGAPVPVYVDVDPTLPPILPPETPEFGDLSWECDYGWGTDSICKVFGFLLVPSGSSFREFINLKDSLAEVVPFGYFFQAIEIRKELQQPTASSPFALPLKDEIFNKFDVALTALLIILFSIWVINFFRDIK